VKKTDIEKLSGSYFIYSNGEYIVLSGKKLYIFTPDGAQVACRSDLRNAERITFLSGNRMLLCSSKLVFHMIALSSGEDIWTVPYTKVDLNVNDFAVTADEAYAYTFDEHRGQLFITELNLQTREIDCFDIACDLGGTGGIICDEFGVPHLLKVVNETIGGKEYCENGVRIHDTDVIYRGSSNYWRAKWRSDPNAGALCFLDQVDKVVTENFQLYNPITGRSVDLLENETDWQRPEESPDDCWLDKSGRYLCLMYPTANVVIDLQQRKVAAQYAADFTRGCLVGDTYWVCTDNQVCRKPFPLFEEVPPAKLMTEGWGMDYSKHPELW